MAGELEVEGLQKPEMALTGTKAANHLHYVMTGTCHLAKMVSFGQSALVNTKDPPSLGLVLSESTLKETEERSFLGHNNSSATLV